MRPSKEEYYLNIASEVAQRGTCLRRKFGAVIVKNDQIISTGYVGAPRGAVNCCDLGYCPREAAGIPPGERYELCRSVHAEANAIIQAAKNGVRIDGSEIYTTASPCWACFKLITNAGIRTIYYGEFYRDVRSTEVAAQLGIHLIDLSQGDPR
jgi:dCMP deaminase